MHKINEGRLPIFLNISQAMADRYGSYVASSWIVFVGVVASETLVEEKICAGAAAAAAAAAAASTVSTAAAAAAAAAAVSAGNHLPDGKTPRP